MKDITWVLALLFTFFCMVGCTSRNGDPIAGFSADTTTGAAPLTVNFTDISIGGSKPIVSWSWLFGNGDESTAQNPSYTYTVPGVYNVSLEVETESGSDIELRVSLITVTGDGEGDGEEESLVNDQPLHVIGTQTTTSTIAPDGGRFFVAHDRYVDVYNTSSMTREKTLCTSKIEILQITCSPDSTFLAAYAWDFSVNSELILWNLASSQVIWRKTFLDSLDERPFLPHNVVFSKDGTRLLVWRANELEVYSIDDGSRLLSLSTDGQIGEALSSSDGMQVLACTPEDKNVYTWNSSTGDLISRWEIPMGASVVFSADGTRLLTNNGDNYTAELWDVSTGVEILRVNHASYPGVLACSSNGSVLSTSSFARTTFWDTASGQELYTRDGGLINQVLITPSGGRAACIGSVEKYIIDLATHSATMITQDIRSGIMSSNGDTLYSCNRGDFWIQYGGYVSNSSIYVTDMASGMSKGLTRDGCDLRGTVISPDGQKMLIFSGLTTWGEVNLERYGRAEIRDCATGSLLYTLRDGSHITSAGFSPDGSRLFLAGDPYDGYQWVELYDVSTGKKLAEFTTPSSDNQWGAWNGSFSPSGSYFSAVHYSPSAYSLVEVVVHNALTGEFAFSPSIGANFVVMSPDDNLIAGRGSNSVIIQNLSTMQYTDIRISGVIDVQFSQDGKRLLCVAADEARVVDVATAEDVGVLQGPFIRGFFRNNDQEVTLIRPENVVVWTPSSGVEQELFAYHGQVLNTDHGPRGSYLLAYDSGSVLLWDESSPTVRAFAAYGGCISASLSRQEDLLLVGMPNSVAALYDTNTFPNSR